MEWVLTIKISEGHTKGHNHHYSFYLFVPFFSVSTVKSRIQCIHSDEKGIYIIDDFVLNITSFRMYIIKISIDLQSM